MLALRDYVTKNGFRRVLLGLSGGFDSALTLAIAVDALGSEQVQPLFLPKTLYFSVDRPGGTSAGCYLIGQLTGITDYPGDASFYSAAAALYCS